MIRTRPHLPTRWSLATRWPLLMLLAVALPGCGVNPVTGKKELQLISESSELQMGAQNYAPTRQGEGGDFMLLPELSSYVNEVGGKLAAVSDRQLPYEFAVLNNSVPNAWALPGGKIAVNRGLLTALESEAELAAVLGHEIVHAAARHGAKAQERGILLQAGVAAAQIGVAMNDTNAQLGSLLVAGAGVGAQMIAMRYGREAELEADHYGMLYMQRAGYDPAAAISLQEKFVALSQQQGGRGRGWLEGLFASHPPSEERVQRNREMAGTLAAGGDAGRERFKARLAPLLAMKPAYDKADEALAAAAKKDYSRAKALAAEAARLQPREARFQQLLGDIALAEKQPQQALGYYEKSLALDRSYFGAWLGGGVAAYRLGEKARAQEWLDQSVQRLPTAPAMYYLGSMARESGNTDKALQYFEAAAGSDSELGKQAAGEFARLDIGRNPGRYVATGTQLDARGSLVAVLENRAPVALEEITVTPVLLDAGGSVAQQGRSVRIGRARASGARRGRRRHRPAHRGAGEARAHPRRRRARRGGGALSTGAAARGPRPRSRTSFSRRAVRGRRARR
ncbi:MAG: M48 family metalloprotease [Steroidobacteraceae bacterium]